jgi:hypothetical protein
MMKNTPNRQYNLFGVFTIILPIWCIYYYTAYLMYLLLCCLFDVFTIILPIWYIYYYTAYLVYFSSLHSYCHFSHYSQLISTFYTISMKDHLHLYQSEPPLSKDHSYQVWFHFNLVFLHKKVFQSLK